MAGEVGKRKPQITAEIDRFIGMRIRERRAALGITQRELAQALGVEPGMMSNYEVGRNSISASRLPEVARLLSVSPAYFFEGLEGHPLMELPAKQQLSLSFMRTLAQIDNKAHLEALAQVVRVLASDRG